MPFAGAVTVSNALPIVPPIFLTASIPASAPVLFFLSAVPLKVAIASFSCVILFAKSLLNALPISCSIKDTSAISSVGSLSFLNLSIFLSLVIFISLAETLCVNSSSTVSGTSLLGSILGPLPGNLPPVIGLTYVGFFAFIAAFTSSSVCNFFGLPLLFIGAAPFAPREVTFDAFILGFDLDSFAALATSLLCF